MTDNEVFELNQAHPAVCNELVEFARICTGSDAKPSIWHIGQIITEDRLLQFSNRLKVEPKKGQSVFEAIMEQGDRRAIPVEPEVVVSQAPETAAKAE